MSIVLALQCRRLLSGGKPSQQLNTATDDRDSSVSPADADHDESIQLALPVGPKFDGHCSSGPDRSCTSPNDGATYSCCPYTPFCGAIGDYLSSTIGASCHGAPIKFDSTLSSSAVTTARATCAFSKHEEETDSSKSSQGPAAG